jgi:hypothetical protein
MANLLQQPVNLTALIALVQLALGLLLKHPAAAVVADAVFELYATKQTGSKALSDILQQPAVVPSLSRCAVFITSTVMTFQAHLLLIAASIMHLVRLWSVSVRTISIDLQFYTSVLVMIIAVTSAILLLIRLFRGKYDPFDKKVMWKIEATIALLGVVSIALL